MILHDTETSVCWVKRHLVTLGLFYLHDVYLSITIVWRHSALALTLSIVSYHQFDHSLQAIIK